MAISWYGVQIILAAAGDCRVASLLAMTVVAVSWSPCAGDDADYRIEKRPESAAFGA